MFREEKDDEILKQRITIEHLRKEIANNQVFQETNNVRRFSILITTSLENSA